MLSRPRILRHQGHHHDHAAHDSQPWNSQTRLSFAFFLTAAFLLVELVTGLWTNSLALTSDAFHMLSDTLALGLGALAARISLRRPTAEKTYGFKRFEVLAAFTNALLLAVFGVVIAFNAAVRLWHPQTVQAEPMLVVAALGLVLNIGIFLWIHRAGQAQGGHSLNEEGVLWHVAGDALGSIAAIAAGAVMVYTGWMRADAVAGLVTASVLLFGAQRVLRQSGHILVEGTPAGVDAAAVRTALETFPGVRAVHDFHLWTLTGRDLYLSAHIDVLPVDAGDQHGSSVTAAVRRDLEARFGALHVTLQTGPCGPHDCGNACR
jgi:cobalt-zinc-cadmium efflux system protein